MFHHLVSQNRSGGEIGRHARLRALWASKPVWVRIPPRAPFFKNRKSSDLRFFLFTHDQAYFSKMNSLEKDLLAIFESVRPANVEAGSIRFLFAQCFLWIDIVMFGL